MKGQRIGYARVSTFDQNVDRQLEGQWLDRIFTDKASGKDVNRPQLDVMLTFAREGDTVVVHSMDRLARNLDDLRKLAQSAPSCDFGQVGERFGNVAFGIDDGNHRRGQFAPS